MSEMTEQSAGATIRPFHVNVPEADLTELRRRINATTVMQRKIPGLFNYVVSVSSH